MSAISIIVNKGIDGFTFSILPSVNDLIRNMFPGAHPANTLYIGYDTASGFDVLESGIEKQVYPMLLGVDKDELKKRIDIIEFVNYQTGKTVKIKP